MTIGDNFHEVVLENKTAIIGMFKQVTAVPKIETMEDSIKLGQIFIAFKLLIPFDRDPRQPAEAKKKYPKAIVPVKP